MSKQPFYEIDADKLARAPNAELRLMIQETPAGSTLRGSILDVFRVIAVRLLSGDRPEGMTPESSARRARNLLQLLSEFRD